MGKWWDRDPRDMTVLEFIHSPISVANLSAMRNNRPRAYAYYDSPEGTDLWKKMWVTTKWGAGIGAFFGIIDVKMYSCPPTFFQSMNRFAFYVVPITGMFVTYGAVTYAATSIRGKDEPLNSAIGGALAGSLAGVWLKNGTLGGFACLFVGLFCAVRKHSADIGHKMFNPITISTMWSDHRNPNDADYSLTSMGNRGWTTGAE